MILLAPQFFWWALAAAVGIVAAHLLVTRQPPSHPLPTVRFVPEAPVRAITLARRPEDRRLLLLRMLVVLLIGLAMAKPVLVPSKRSVARVVLWDRSSAVADPKAARDSVLAWRQSGDVVVAFDSVARVVEGELEGEVSRESRAAGRASPGLIVALRTASRLRASADSIELVIVSPLTGAEWDAATPSIRALWPGRIRLVHVAAARDTEPETGRVEIVGASDDPLTLASRLLTPDSRPLTGSPPGATVRILRQAASATDSNWAASGPRVLVRWPIDPGRSGGQAGPKGPPDGRGRPDTSGAVIVGGAALVYPFARSWGPGTGDPASRVVARWADGAVAAVERSVGQGCIRDVAVPVESRGDLILRADFARFFDAMTAPCGRAGISEAPAPVDTALLAGSGPLASSSVIRPSQSVPTPLAPFLLAAALILSLVELGVRRQGTALAIEGDA